MLALGVAFVIPDGASAQAPEDEETLEEIIVTGSRIGRDPGSYVGPMMVLDGTSIQENPNFSLNDTLLKMPSIGAQGTHRQQSNGGRGASFSGIHQLAPERTLTMWNGKRTVSTIRDTLGLGVDLQAFPVNLIDRVELLADGASAVYGSDAIAGVINLIPRTDFDGMELSFGAGAPSDDGGEHIDVGVTFGVTGPRGFFSAGFSYVRDGDVDFQEREFSRIPILGINDEIIPGTPLTIMGSGIPPQGRAPNVGIIFEPDPGTGLSYQPYDTFCLNSANPGSDGSGSLGCIFAENHRFNYNDIATGSSLINQNNNLNFMGIGEYNFDNDVTGYINVNIAHRDGQLNFTPLPIADASGRFIDLIQVPYFGPNANPNIPADAIPAIRAVTCTDPADDATCAPTFQMWWRVLDLGPRNFNYDSDTIGATFGLKGSFAAVDREWNWDAWFTAGRSELWEVTLDQVNVSKLQTAMDPAACRADQEFSVSCPLDASGNPTMNIFGRGAKSQAEKDYILFDDQERTNYEMLHLAATISGELASLPAGSLGFAAGLELRNELGGVQTSGVVQAGDSGGNFADPTQGEYDVWEAYAEFAIPLVEQLSVDAAVRFSDYDTFGSETTYKASLAWAPVESLRFRGVISTGFRAPNILELFGGVADNFLTVEDPCGATITDGPNRPANCAADGVPVGFLQPASQLKVSAGGNPTLTAETSDNFSVGLVWAPEFADLRITIDWYDVEIEGAIGTPDPVDVINACYDGAVPLADPNCGRIGRGPTGSVVRFDLLNENLSIIQTSGVDVDSSYVVDTGAGQLSFELLLEWLNEYVEISDTGIVSDRTNRVAGLVSDWAAYPEWRSNLGIMLARDTWSVGLNWRYLSKMDITDVIGFETLRIETPAQNYFDIVGKYDVGAWTLMVGVQNLTDEDPPYVPDVATNTSGIFDFLGPFYHARATISFQ